MTGFFTKTQVASKSRPDGKILSCISCGAYKNCQSPKMEPEGAFAKQIMIIGTTPTQIDDKNTLHFQGKSGKLLFKAFTKFGINLLEDCILTNAIKCRVTNEDDENREPTKYEIECCRKYIFTAIAKYKPKIIFLLGDSAVFSVIGHRWKKELGTIDKWRGWQIPDQELKAWICPIYEPHQIELAKGTETAVIWKQDIEKGLSKLKEVFPVKKEPNIKYITDLTELKLMSYESTIAFDYETTGLKPYAAGHKIICASVATSEYEVFVFMLPKSRKEQKPFKDLLTNPEVAKVAQNMKFEDTWSKIKLGVEVQNWKWDTMLATHLLDNRPGVTGLKFQVYVQFGIIDYSSEIEPYLQATDDKNSNSLNRIEELIAKPGGKEKLMKYCAYDSIYEMRLAMLQQSLIIELPF